MKTNFLDIWTPKFRSDLEPNLESNLEFNNILSRLLMKSTLNFVLYTISVLIQQPKILNSLFISISFTDVWYKVEIIIVDDNSADGTAEIAEFLSKEYPGKIHIQRRAGKKWL